MNGVRLHLIVTKPQNAKLTRLSEKTGLPVSELLRRAIDSYLGAASGKDVRGSDSGSA
jgi:hypothetical protein